MLRAPLSNLVFKTDTIIIGGDFNIHVDNNNTLSNDIAALDDIALASNETVRNLGVHW